MKLRDRQEKMEHVLSFYKDSSGSSSQLAKTSVRGEVDVVGALLMIDTVGEKHCDMIKTAGIRTGIDLKFVFESPIRNNDTLVVEFVAGGKRREEVLASELSLAKVLYVSNINNWFSAVAIPVGAQYRDVGVATIASHQVKGLTHYSAFEPPLLNQNNGCSFGVTVRKSNVVASVAQFVSRPIFPTNASRIMHCFSTFGQVVYQLSQSTKLSLFGVHKVRKFRNQSVSLGAMTMPIGMLKNRKLPETFVEEDTPSVAILERDILLDGSIAMMLESELDENARLSGWIEMKQSNAKYLQWALNVSDNPENDFGWGFSMGGLVQGLRNWDNFQVEAYLNFNIGKKFRLKPGFLYLNDGSSGIPALMLQSCWSI